NSQTNSHYPPRDLPTLLSLPTRRSSDLSPNPPMAAWSSPPPIPSATPRRPPSRWNSPSPVLREDPPCSGSMPADGHGPLPSSGRSEEHTSELQSRENLVCRLLLEKKKHK